jgi:hypothetical protein
MPDETPDTLMEDLALKIMGMRQLIGVGMPLDQNLLLKLSFTCDLVALFVLRTITNERINAKAGKE